MGFVIQLLITCFLLGIGFYVGMLFEKRKSINASNTTKDVSVKGDKKQKKEKQRKASKTRSGGTATVKSLEI